MSLCARSCPAVPVLSRFFVSVRPLVVCVCLGYTTVIVSSRVELRVSMPMKTNFALWFFARFLGFAGFFFHRSPHTRP